MRKVKEIREDVLSSPGRYREVRPEGSSSKDPAPLKVKEVVLSGKRYIVCLNPKQARKDARDRQAIIDSLQEKIKTNPKSLIGNKGYRKYLKIERDSVSINQDKIKGSPDLTANGCSSPIRTFQWSKLHSSTRNCGRWSKSSGM